MSSLGYSLSYNPGNILGADNRVIITPEMKALMTPFSDPLFRNFKILLDTSCKEYLLAPAKNEDGTENVNSAEAYLRRIGEDERADMLQAWVEMTKSLFRDYEFLIMNITGLESTFNFWPHVAFKAEDDITVEFRETIDMKVFTWYNMYRDIWYDSIRNVEVIPTNLRRIPFSVMIYSSGYYSSDMYDDWDDAKYAIGGYYNDYEDIANIDAFYEKDNIARHVLPTHIKLSRITDAQDLKNLNTNDNNNKNLFNYTLIEFPAAIINCEKSGEGYANNVTNEPSSDLTKVSITFNYYSANVKHIATNLTGPYSFKDMLALIAAQSKFETTSNAITGSNISLYNQNFVSKWLNTLKERTGVRSPNKWVSDFMNSWKNAANNMINSTRIVGRWMLQNATDNLLNSRFVKDFKTYTDPNFLSKLATQQYTKLLDKGVDALGQTEFGKFLTTNFSNNINQYIAEGLRESHNAVSLFMQKNPQYVFPENPTLDENMTTQTVDTIDNPTMKQNFSAQQEKSLSAVKKGKSNINDIYSRKGF